MLTRMQHATPGAAEYPGVRVTRMARNNPGFGILVGELTAPTRYFELKSTR